jgi:DNA-binding CsgD family transcriptional regulator
MELAFAGLHQLCAPMLDRVEHLPGPQRDAWRVTFGLTEGIPPDRFLVGVAALSLLSEVAEEQPLICLVDDAQWLDRASVQCLAFVARRLMAERIGLIFAVRRPSDERALMGLPELEVGRLSDQNARLLLASAIRGPVDEQVRDRIVAETRGNPLALLELHQGLTPAELAGGFGLPTTRPLSSHLEQGFLRRLSALPADTQQLLLIAAAEPVGDVALLRRAAQRLGISAAAAGPAENDGLIELGARVRFRHPLVRSAVYRQASPEQRRAVHRALAEATDLEVDPDRGAWHRAQATSEPDENVAGQLERSAGRAQARGGLAAAATFLEQAARLTVDPMRRADRSIAAARAKYQVGAPDAARDLLAAVESGPLDELLRARIGLLRGQMAFASGRSSDGPLLLLEAARRLEPIDVRLARETYLDALSAAMFVGRLDGGVGLLAVAKAARGAPVMPQPVRPLDLLLDGLALLITDGYAVAAPVVRRALSAFRGDEISPGDKIRWLFLACRSAHDMWDDEGWDAFSAQQVRIARDAGALAVLPLALTQRIGLELHAGGFADAASLVAEAESVTEATGNGLPRYGAMALASWQGRDGDASQLMAATLDDVTTRGEGMALGLVQYTSAVLHNGLGRYGEALAAAELASAYPEELGFSNWGLVELIEAAVRSGQAAHAAGALERLAATTRPCGTEWGLGIEARSRALVSDGEVAERLYREAIERLGRSRAVMALARAHLVYGEWLRRESRRVDGRTQLRTAHEMFVSIGAHAFAERARRELLATGETVRKRTLDTRDELTAQERQIAWLARDGHTNSEIGAELFLSSRTVEYHLHKVFTKLRITSRRELRKELPGRDAVAVPG